MKVIGVMTSDFSVYHDLIQELRDRGLPFVSLTKGAEIPPHVGVVLTSDAELDDIAFPEVVAAPEPADAVEAAQRVLSGHTFFRRVVIGIDPGEHPGVAILGDGHVLSSAQAASPEHVPPLVERAILSLTAQFFTLRVGDGAPTFRDRILLGLLPLGVSVELVDERSSTPTTYASSAQRDIIAAKAIALARGAPVERVAEVRPSVGELRDIQRKSRITSQGRLTISRQLAWDVAVGKLSLDEAVLAQKAKNGADGGESAASEGDGAVG